MQNIDTRERLLTLIDILSRTSSSVKEIQEQFINNYGVAPDRKTLYQDLAAIENIIRFMCLKRIDVSACQNTHYNPQSTVPLLFNIIHTISYHLRAILPRCGEGWR